MKGEMTQNARPQWSTFTSIPGGKGNTNPGGEDRTLVLTIDQTLFVNTITPVTAAAIIAAPITGPDATIPR